MKRIFLTICLIFLLAACTKDNQNIIFKAVVESVSENSILVTTTDNVGFDKASVNTENAEFVFDIIVGQTVEIEILPEIRESYPVQVTAVKIHLIDKEETMINNTEYIKLTGEEAKDIIDSDKNIIILDVRTEAEYNQGHIENAVLLPDTEINDNAEAILSDKDLKILVYCRSGRRSAVTAKELIKMGYTDVYDFGGIIDWPYDIVK